MDGYDETTYGNAFADVYDEWYAGVSDIDATVTTLTRLAATPHPPARVLELGVGTGRLAVPLARANRSTMSVTGIDASIAMLDRLRDRDTERLITIIVGHMVTDLPDDTFDLAFIAYNTLFNLTGCADGSDEQAECFRQVANRLVPGGRFVVEAFVPDDPPRRGDDISVRSLTADRVVLSITRQSGHDGFVEGQFVELTESNGVRLRPWSIRHRSPVELDGLAEQAGLVVESRWEDMTGTAFTTHSDRHVTVYRAPGRDRTEQSDVANP